MSLDAPSLEIIIKYFPDREDQWEAEIDLRPTVLGKGAPHDVVTASGRNAPHALDQLLQQVGLLATFALKPGR